MKKIILLLMFALSVSSCQFLNFQTKPVEIGGLGFIIN